MIALLSVDEILKHLEAHDGKFSLLRNMLKTGSYELGNTCRAHWINNIRDLYLRLYHPLYETNLVYRSLMEINAYATSPVGIYLFKVNNRNTRTRCEICSKLTIKTTERRY